ncbi:roadblock/LC7 domain-containing protein [Streptomyces pini]|uniref:Roadblock/LC7 domain-containing protein n=1 Tax=Streptomyces pini TaxID=1520580 RepID=A0A1I3WLA9_9ACTN|nr:roadblock/LC7 domain-containing protein [Streptomyces pini]SFK07969.1 Roadblock/LC7 domain-containing protein [Streptomyces pini]
MDWVLKDLAVTVPRTRHTVLLSADGLCMARWGADKDAADRPAAASSGLKSLAQSVAADEGVDAGLMSRRMRDLVIRIGDHLASPPRAPERAP